MSRSKKMPKGWQKNVWGEWVSESEQAFFDHSAMTYLAEAAEAAPSLKMFDKCLSIGKFQIPLYPTAIEEFRKYAGLSHKEKRVLSEKSFKSRNKTKKTVAYMMKWILNFRETIKNA